MAALGAKGGSMPVGEVLSALQQGTLDGAETSLSVEVRQALSISPSRSLPSKWLNDLCPKAFEIGQTRCEVVRQVVELAGDMRQFHLIPAARQALTTILVVARD